jgi:hypothetical protein
MGSSFDLKKNRGISIAEGREKIKANDMFRSGFLIPGPPDYNPEIHEVSCSYSIGSRRESKADKWMRSIPGPGAYSTFDITGNEEAIPLSKFIASPSIRFGRLKRITEPDLRNKKFPGPGQCNSIII